MADDREIDGGDTVLAASIMAALLGLRYGAGLRRQAGSRVTALQRAILAAVREAELDAIASPLVRQVAQDRLTAELTARVTRTYGAILGELDGDLRALVGVLTEHGVATVRRATDQPVDSPSDAEIDAAVGSMLVVGASIRAWVEKSATDLNFRLGRLVAEHARGTGPAETAQAIRSAVGAGLAAVETTVRSAVTAANAVAVSLVVAANAGRSIQGWIWSSVLDSRTTELCRSRANLRFDADRKPVGHDKSFKIPPIHPNCRSSLVPWLIDSPAPREPTLAEFLRSLSDTQAGALVGKKALELFRSSRITQVQLLDQRARPITLRQLRRLLGLE